MLLSSPEPTAKRTPVNVKRTALAGLVLAFLVVSPAWSGDAAALLGQLRKTYEGTRDLRARFLQTSHLVAAGMDRTASGEALFQKGGRMRWSYEGDDPQVIVSDGQTLWIYQVRDKTVLRQELSAVPAESRLALDLLSGFDGVETFFRVETCGPLCLVLTPKEPRHDVARVTVEFADEGRAVSAVLTEDPLGNRTRLEFREVRRNGGVPEGAFLFEPPKGVQVVEAGGGR